MRVPLSPPSRSVWLGALLAATLPAAEGDPLDGTRQLVVRVQGLTCPVVSGLG